MDLLRFAPLSRRFPGTHLMRRTCPAYDEKRLTEHGWKVERHPVSPDPQSDVPGDFSELSYEVHYWPTSLGGGSKTSDFTTEALDREGTGAQVLVYRR